MRSFSLTVFFTLFQACVNREVSSVHNDPELIGKNSLAGPVEPLQCGSSPAEYFSLQKTTISANLDGMTFGDGTSDKATQVSNEAAIRLGFCMEDNGSWTLQQTAYFRDSQIIVLSGYLTSDEQKGQDALMFGDKSQPIDLTFIEQIKCGNHAVGCQAFTPANGLRIQSWTKDGDYFQTVSFWNAIANRPRNYESSSTFGIFIPGDLVSPLLAKSICPASYFPGEAAITAGKVKFNIDTCSQARLGETHYTIRKISIEDPDFAKPIVLEKESLAQSKLLISHHNFSDSLEIKLETKSYSFKKINGDIAWQIVDKKGKEKNGKLTCSHFLNCLDESMILSPLKSAD